MKLTGIPEHSLTAEMADAWTAIGLKAVGRRLRDLADDRLAPMD